MFDCVRNALRSIRSYPKSEKALHEEMALCFARVNLSYRREVKINGGWADFVIEDTVIEVKLKCSPLKVYQQIGTYLLSPALKQGIIVTTRAMKIPLTKVFVPTDDGVIDKPLHVLELWKQFI